MKYSEAGYEPAPPPNPRYAEIAHTTPGLFIAPDDPTLIGPACQQLYRQHCLAAAMPTAGLADTATLAFIAPAHNQLAHAAAATYNRQLPDPHAGPIPFVPVTLEHAFTAMAAAGLPDHAGALHRRYTNWWAPRRRARARGGSCRIRTRSDLLAEPARPPTGDTTSATKSVNRSRPQRTRFATRTRTAA